jgi:hypothetical protein
VSLLLMLRSMPWKLIGLGALALFIGSLMLALKIERTQNDKLKAQITACAEGRQADRTAYEAAQKAAAEKNKATVARIESEQERINDEVESNLTARLERLRRELRAQAAPGSAGGTPTGPDGKTPGVVDGAPRMCPSPEELLRGAENEERHDQLITWIEKQLGVKR